MMYFKLRNRLNFWFCEVTYGVTEDVAEAAEFTEDKAQEIIDNMQSLSDTLALGPLGVVAIHIGYVDCPAGGGRAWFAQDADGVTDYMPTEQEAVYALDIGAYRLD